jgi:Cu-Zn family superoxide dismutase
MSRAIAALALLALSVPAAAGAQAPDRYVLPGDRVFPEGVALRPGTDQFFVTSTQDGTVFRGDLDRPRMSVYLRGGTNGLTNAIGIEATRDRLLIAGGAGHRVDVWDLRRKRAVRRFNTGSTGTVNDIAIAPDGDAYVTDTGTGRIFRLPARQIAQRGGPTRVRPLLTISDDLAPDGYVNGIVAAGRRYLVVSVTTARLLRVDLRTKRVTRVALTGGDVPVPDGMVLRGRTLYVVNSANRVTQLRLSRTAASARVIRNITSTDFALPTTVAIAGRRLLVVNSQFNRRTTTPVLPFTVSSVPRP